MAVRSSHPSSNEYAPRIRPLQTGPSSSAASTFPSPRGRRPHRLAASDAERDALEDVDAAPRPARGSVSPRRFRARCSCRSWKRSDLYGNQAASPEVGRPTGLPRQAARSTPEIWGYSAECATPASQQRVSSSASLFALPALFAVLPSAGAGRDGCVPSRCRIVALGDRPDGGLRPPPPQAAVPPQRCWRRRLKEEGYENVTIVNAGVSGDTASGGPRFASTGRCRIRDRRGHPGTRRQRHAARARPADHLRGARTRPSRGSRSANIPVLLAGMLAAAQHGRGLRRGLRRDFYPRLAEEHDLVYYPFFLEGALTNPALMLDDGIHPNAAGVEVMVDNMLSHNHPLHRAASRAELIPAPRRTTEGSTMEYRPLGRTGLRVSALCLGTIDLGPAEQRGARATRRWTTRSERGINFIDTAELYAIPPKPEDARVRPKRIIGSWLKARGTARRRDPPTK